MVHGNYYSNAQGLISLYGFVGIRNDAINNKDNALLRNLCYDNELRGESYNIVSQMHRLLTFIQIHLKLHYKNF